MYFIRIESCVFSDVSRITFCFVIGITAVLKAAERQI